MAYKEEVTLMHSDSLELKNHLGLENGIVLIKQLSGEIEKLPISDLFITQGVINWINSRVNKKVLEFNEELLESTSDNGNLLFVFVYEEVCEFYSRFLEVAKLRGKENKVIFSNAKNNKEDTLDLLKIFKIKAKKVPFVVALQFIDDSVKKFVLRKDKFEEIEDWVQHVISGKQQVYLFSQITNNNNKREIEAISFERKVLEETKQIVLMAYPDNCLTCDEMKKILVYLEDLNEVEIFEVNTERNDLMPELRLDEGIYLFTGATKDIRIKKVKELKQVNSKEELLAEIKGETTKGDKKQESEEL